MGAVETIEAGIRAEIQTELGAAFKELDYVNDVASNRFKSGTKRYGVLIDSFTPSEGVTRHITNDQDFLIILTESFAPGATNDSPQRAAARILFNRLEEIHKRLINVKAGAPGYVIRVGNMSGRAVEYVDENVAVLRATITIKYRIAL